MADVGFFFLFSFQPLEPTGFAHNSSRKQAWPLSSCSEGAVMGEKGPYRVWSVETPIQSTAQRYWCNREEWFGAYEWVLFMSILTGHAVNLQLYDNNDNNK